VVAALALVALCVMLSAIASALVLSPSIARTRRAILAAYRPTPTATATSPVTVAPVAGPPAVLESPPATPEVSEPVTVTATVTASVTATADAPLKPTDEVLPSATPPQAPPTPTVALPPTFTPAPAQPPQLSSPIEAPPLLTATVAVTAIATAVLPTPTPTLTPTAAPVTPTVTPTPTLGVQVTPGGTILVSAINVQGNPSLNEADEYVEIRNTGSVQVDMANWVLKAFHFNEQVDSFPFEPGFIMAGGQVCRIYTNLTAGPENCGLVDGFARGEPLWPNAGVSASARLYNAQNVEVARFTY
jgi:hypothetical protein